MLQIMERGGGIVGKGVVGRRLWGGDAEYDDVLTDGQSSIDAEASLPFSRHKIRLIFSEPFNALI